MPRTGSRKRTVSTTTTTTSVCDNSATMWNSKKKRNSNASSMLSSSSGATTTTSGVISESAAAKLFAEFADPDDPQTATMDGILELGKKLDIDALEDVRILVLLWKMNVREKPSQISKQEWIQGCAALHCDSWDKFKSVLVPSLDTGFLETAEFKDFYKFCFQFSRQGTHKSLDKDLVVELLPLVLGSSGGNNNSSGNSSGQRVPLDRLNSFCEFLMSNPSYTHISLDQWSSFLDFCTEVQDLSTYDESTSAWPVMMDEYVEYMEQLQKNNNNNTKSQQQQHKKK